MEDTTSWGLRWEWTYPQDPQVLDTDGLPAYPIDVLLNDHSLGIRDKAEIEELIEHCDIKRQEVYDFVRVATLDNADQVLFNVFNQNPDELIDKSKDQDKKIVCILEQDKYFALLHGLVLDEMGNKTVTLNL